jgi:hypothetical protein
MEVNYSKLEVHLNNIYHKNHNTKQKLHSVEKCGVISVKVASAYSNYCNTYS